MLENIILSMLNFLSLITLLKLYRKYTLDCLEYRQVVSATYSLCKSLRKSNNNMCFPYTHVHSLLYLICIYLSSIKK